MGKHMWTRTLSIGLVTLTLLPNCVSKGDYDAALKDAADAKAAALRQSQEAQARDEAHQAEIERLKSALEAAATAARERDTQVAQMSAHAGDLQQQLDRATAMNQSLRDELTRLGKDVDKLLADKGTLSKDLEEANQRLEELRKAQAAAEKRAALFRELALKFQKMIDAGELKIVLRDGRMVLQLSNDILFDSGQTKLKPAGQDALTRVASVLSTLTDRRFQVAGHTDNVPIQRSNFDSNWDLSTARGVVVVEFLIEKGVKPENLSAAGYGEFDPIADNATPEGKSKNRRIEIVLQPNIEELVSVPDTK